MHHTHTHPYMHYRQTYTQTYTYKLTHTNLSTQTYTHTNLHTYKLTHTNLSTTFFLLLSLPRHLCLLLLSKVLLPSFGLSPSPVDTHGLQHTRHLWKKQREQKQKKNEPSFFSPAPLYAQTENKKVFWKNNFFFTGSRDWHACLHLAVLARVTLFFFWKTKSTHTDKKERKTQQGGAGGGGEQEGKEILFGKEFSLLHITNQNFGEFIKSPLSLSL